MKIKTNHTKTPYITAGKEYPVEVVDLNGGFFVNDRGEKGYTAFLKSFHLSGKDWEIVAELEKGE